MLWDSVQVPLVPLSFWGGKNSAGVSPLDVMAVGQSVAMDVSQFTSCSMKDSFGGSCVPFLATRAAKDVSVGLALQN